ncbi:MAG: SGNH/GDSL hydrolase family protein [Geminicoccaceae bacterium]
MKRGGLAKVVFWNVVVLVTLIGMGEVVCRLAVTYNPSYYTSIDVEGRDLIYPYGVVKMNAHGHPDDEFDLNDPRPRIAYVGDSVTWGVGAGHGYRFSDILERKLPGFQHMTLASVADGFRTKKRMDYVKNQANALGADHVIYFYNLNDTLPDIDQAETSAPIETVRRADMLSSDLLTDVINVVRANTEGLRNKSYLFNWLRFKIRVLLLQLGIEYHGEEAYELFPEKNKDIIAQTATRIRYLNDMLEEQGIGFLVVLVPYEMQISKDAARTYASLGINWEQGFLNRRLQQLLAQHLEPEIRTIDAYEAFVNDAEDREKIKVGELFVYDEGDSLDWNHPNREGHKKIAAFLESHPLFLDTIKGH